MNKFISNLLSYPFDKGVLPEYSSDASVLSINALPINGLRVNDVLIFNAISEALWQGNAINFVNGVSQKLYDYILCAVPKNKIEAQYFISLISKGLKEDGKVIVVASNDAGGKNLSKWMNDFGFIGESYSKSKCRIYVGSPGELDKSKTEAAYKKGSMQNLELDGQKYYTQAGVFGWNKIDQGSKLLIEKIDEPLKGSGADFGCGYGYLSNKILGAENKIKKLHMIDVDMRAIECAKLNMEQFSDGTDVHFAVSDLTVGTPFKEKLDFIVMNPPFHEGKTEKKSLGISMIETAYNSLKKNGVLYMVANKQLPYEKVLDRFYKVEKLAEEQGFKVYKAVR